MKELEATRQREEALLTLGIMERLREAFPTSPITDDQVTQAINEHVIPPLRALGRIGIHDLLPPPDDPAQGDSSA